MRRIGAISFVALGAAASPFFALAQQPPVLEEILVIGRGELLSPGMASGSADYLHPEEQLSLNRTLGDWIEHMPGISLNGQGGLFQSYSIRGFSRWRVRTELNGVPIITDRRAGNSASFVPPELIEQVRVDRAASSALYGSGAMGGVVSLGTRRADGPLVIAGAQSNDEQMSLTAINGSPERITAGVSMRKAQKASDPSGAPLNSGFEQIAGVIAGSADVGELSLSYSWIPSLGRDIGKSNSFFPERRQSSYPEELHSVAQLELRSAGSWLLRGYHHYQDWDADVERLGQRRNLTHYRSHTVGGLFMVSSDQFGGEGSAGLEWLGRRGVVIKDEEFDPAGELQFQQELVDGEEDTLSLFVDQRWSHEALTFSAGLRVDGNCQSEGPREETDTQWSSSLALAYALSETWSVDAEVASGYRFPALSERFFNGATPRGDTLGNPDLKPETRQNFEVDLRYAPPGSAFSAEASAYYSDLGDYIERYSVDSNTVSYRNLDEASIHGLEFDLQFRAGAIDHRLSYQWQRGEDDDGNTLADLNPPGWRYFLNWRGENQSLSSDLSYRASRERFGAEEMPLDSAWIWNAQFTQALSAAWQGELYVNNILDETYRATADDTAPFQPGRIVGLRLLWKPS